MMRCAPSTADEYGAAVPPGQYVRLFSGLRRSTSREYHVLLADDQMLDRTAATEGRLWRGAIPDQPSRTATRSRSCIGSIGDPHGMRASISAAIFQQRGRCPFFPCYSWCRITAIGSRYEASRISYCQGRFHIHNQDTSWQAAIEHEQREIAP
jgi:hypothetical protein